MFKKIFLLFSLVFIISIGSACWDRIEIERNAFILGLGIDLGSDDDLIITYQIALLDAFKGEEGGKSKSTQQISIKSTNLSKASDALLRHFGNVPNLSHCKLVIFGEEYARKGIENSLDYLFREPEIRRITSVCVAEGKAKDILDIESKTSDSSALMIDQIVTQNSNSNSGIFPFPDIGYLHRNFIRDSDFSLVKVSCKEDMVKVSGAGVFKNRKMVGWFTEKEVTGQRFILSEIHKALLNTDMPWDQGGRITLNAYNIETSIIPKIENNDIMINANILIEGDVNEVGNPKPIEDSDELFELWQKATEKDIESTINLAFKKGRDDFGVDTFEIDERLEGYYPSFWKENKDNWRELFKNTKLNLKIKVKIRRVGIITP